MSTWQKLENKQAYRVIHQPVSVVLQFSLNAWLKGLASRDQCRLMGSGSTLGVSHVMRSINVRYLFTY